MPRTGRSKAGCLSGPAFSGALTAIWKESRERPEQQVTLLLLDIDNLHQLNTVHGREAGDRACPRYGAQVVLLQLRSARSIEGARRAQAVKGGRAPARGARGRSPQVRSRLNLARRWGLLSGVVIRSFLVVTIALVAAASGDRGVALAGPAAVVERGGVVLRLELDRGAIAPGELLWATLTVSNTNDHDLKWTAGG